MEKETETQSSILAWKISWTEEPSGLPSMGSQKGLDTCQQLNNKQEFNRMYNVIPRVMTEKYMQRVKLKILLKIQ